jgi:hypothetical protein
MRLDKLISRLPGDTDLKWTRLLFVTLLSFGISLLVLLVIAWLNDEKSTS